MILILAALFLFPFAVYGQAKFLLPNEEMVFSFTTAQGKEMVLAKDRSDKYLVYRFGTREKIEMEYPEKTNDSWKKFNYSYYLRSGGEENAGLDLNYLCFLRNGIRYVIYDSYSAESASSYFGVKVIVPGKTGTDIEGYGNSRKGNLLHFRDNDLVETSEEQFD